MYSLHLECRTEDVEQLIFALWQAGTSGIRQEEQFDGFQGGHVLLIAGFEDATQGEMLLTKFASYQPAWRREDDTDWVAATREAWPGRAIGERLFLAPTWNSDATPQGRLRLIHNPGMASGTGEHPCTRLALESLERCITPNCRMLDVGTGSGILAAAALRLEARTAIGLDLDLDSLKTARENLALNDYQPMLVAGSTDCLAGGTADVVVANISGTVLLSLVDDLHRILHEGGRLIVTGFPESELNILQQAFGDGEVTAIDEWRCLTIRV